MACNGRWSPSRAAKGLCSLGLAVVTMTGRPADASTCAIDLGLDYRATQSFAAPGDVVRVRLTLGTKGIDGGTVASVRALRFFLACNGGGSRLVPCAADAPVVAYGGDDTIASTCVGLSWSTGHNASARPNQVVFRPNMPLDVPANTPSFCELEFDVTVLAPSRDGTPGRVEQLASVGFGKSEAQCDNGLRAATAVSGGISVP